MEIAKLVLDYLKALAWPLAFLIALLIFKHELSSLFNSTQYFELPGGVKFFLKRQIKTAEEAANKIESLTKRVKPSDFQKTLNQLNTQIKNIGFNRSLSNYDLNYYKDMAYSNPNVALAGLRMEVELMLQNMAKASGVEYDRFHTSPGGFSRLLFDKNVLNHNEYELLLSIINVANAGIHGREITVEDALRTIDTTEPFLHSYFSYMENAVRTYSKKKKTR